jgi:Putative peptidase (DUF1758).
MNAACGIFSSCVNCHKGNHTVSKCNKFLNLSVNERWDAVIKQAIYRKCLTPLQSGHNYNCNMSCKHCGKYHKDFTRNGQNLTALVSRSRANNKVTCSSTSSILNNCILPTAKVKLSSTTRCLKTTALLDSGTNCNLITKNLAKRLKLKGCFRKIYVQGVSGMSQATNQIVELRIKSNDESWTSTIQCLVVDSITSPLPASNIDVSDWNIPNKLRLADPDFNISKHIGVLLSSDIVFNVLCNGKIVPKYRNLPFILNSKLG